MCPQSPAVPSTEQGLMQNKHTTPLPELKKHPLPWPHGPDHLSPGDVPTHAAEALALQEATALRRHVAEYAPPTRLEETSTSRGGPAASLLCPSAFRPEEQNPRKLVCEAAQPGFWEGALAFLKE